MKHTLAAMTYAIALVASLAACGGSEGKSGLPTFTGGSNHSTTATSQPSKTPHPATATSPGPVALKARSTYTYDGLQVVVNLPADIPKASRPSMRVFLEFLQADGRTTARNKIDPSLPRLASAAVVKDTKGFLEGTSATGIGTVTYTVSKVHTGGSGFTVINGCLDQSKLVQVRKDGTHYVDANTKKKPTLKMTANINPGLTGPKVTLYTFAGAAC